MLPCAGHVHAYACAHLRMHVHACVCMCMQCFPPLVSTPRPLKSPTHLWMAVHSMARAYSAAYIYIHIALYMYIHIALYAWHVHIALQCWSTAQGRESICTYATYAVAVSSARAGEVGTQWPGDQKPARGSKAGGARCFPRLSAQTPCPPRPPRHPCPLGEVCCGCRTAARS